MVIDFHTHIFSADICGDRTRACADRQFQSIYGHDKSALSGHRDLIAEMERAGVDRSVAMGFPWERDDICAAQNEYLRSVASDTGGSIIPFGSVPVNASADIESWVRKIKEMGLKGVGEVGFYRDGMTAENLRYLKRLLAAVRSHSLPLCLHVNEPVGHRYPGKYDPNLGELFDVISEYSGVPIILSHWGGGLLFYELMPEVSRALAHCYYDTAATPYLYNEEIYGIAVRIAGSKRLLLGSDYPLLRTARYMDSINRFVPDPVGKADILGMNAARLLAG
jgi:uncharacterized protein